MSPRSLVIRAPSRITFSTGEVVVYCDCPNEASAARVAQQLKNIGFRRVRPLAGGLDAWSAEGLPVDRD